MPEAFAAEAPGRVNLIGEHTDYHDGYVLPAVIPLVTQAHVRRRRDRRVGATSNRIAGPAVEYDLGDETRGRGWIDYVQGVTAVLRQRRIPVPGFDLHLESTIPVGAGLSSSAALTVALLRALRALLQVDLDDLSLARLAHAVETDFVGAPVGLMDPIASSLGREHEALFLDLRTLDRRRIAIPAAIDIAVVDSGVAHAHAGGEYARRRSESFEAARRLGVSTLRDLPAELRPSIERLPPVLARRARHVVTENERVLAAVDAFQHGRTEELRTIFAASHASMRDDYETSTGEIDTLVRLAGEHPDVYAARLTGGGFGGAVVLLARQGRGGAAARAVCDAYSRETGVTGTVVVPVQN